MTDNQCMQNIIHSNNQALNQRLKQDKKPYSLLLSISIDKIKDLTHKSTDYPKIKKIKKNKLSKLLAKLRDKSDSSNSFAILTKIKKY